MWCNKVIYLLREVLRVYFIDVNLKFFYFIMIIDVWLYVFVKF